MPAANSLSLCATWMVASIRITTVFPKSTSATRDGGSRPWRAPTSPHTCRPAGPRPPGGDPVPLILPDLVQRPPQRGIGGDRAVQLALIAQRGQIRQHRAAVGDHHRGVDQDSTPVMHRREVTAAQRLRQRRGQARPVGQHAQRSGPSVRHDSVPAHIHTQVVGPLGKLHGKSAPRPGLTATSTTALSQLRSTFRAHDTPITRSR